MAIHMLHKSVISSIITLFIVFNTHATLPYCPTNVPMIIAHHGGGKDWPENTCYAIKQDEQLGIKVINLTLELSKDNIPFLFHGFDLSKTTNGIGNPETMKMSILKKLDDGYRFQDAKGHYIYRGKKIRIPTLKEALLTSHVTLIIDIKTHRYIKLIEQLNKFIPKNDWDRIIFYSTNKKIIQSLIKHYPWAHVFQKRENTRKLLFNNMINPNQLKLNKAWHWQWLAFENSKAVSICEHFTLGKSCTHLTFNHLWNKNIIIRIHAHYPNAKLIMIGVEQYSLYQYAKNIGMNAVYTNAPKEMLATRHCIDKKDNIIDI